MRSWKNNFFGLTDHEFMLFMWDGDCQKGMSFEISDFQMEMSARELDSCNKKPEERAGLGVQDYNSYIFRL